AADAGSAALRGPYVQATLAAVSAALHAAEAYTRWRNAAVAAAGRLPCRLERLERRLGLSGKEAALLRFVLFSQTSQEELLTALTGEGRLARLAQPSAPAFVGMSTQEFLAFVAPERRHIREGLLQDISKALLSGTEGLSPWGGLTRGCSLTLGLEVVKALIGEGLSQEELLKIDKTAVMEVLCEEPGFAASREGHAFPLGPEAAGAA
ncbi:hypothetical protein Agub_g9647, partial [Astrephomene gubernaculifera]